MNINCNELFKSAFIISINKNKYLKIKTIFEANNLTGFHQFIGFTDPDLKGKKKCGLSHAAIIRMAQANNLPYVCIFEDDAYPCIDVKIKIDKELQNIPNDTDLFLLGWCNKITQTKNKLTSQCNGSHAYIVFQCCYDKFLKCYDQISEKHIDRIYFELSKIGNVLCASENLFIQYSEQTSMNNHIGYIYDGKDMLNPPAGFQDISAMKFKPIIDKQALFEILKNIQISEMPNLNKCILIGGNKKKIQKIYARKYIDLTTYSKIRLNTLPDQKLISFYGKRTDLFICTNQYLKSLQLKNKKTLQLLDSLILTISKIFLISNVFTLDIDFISAVICANKFSSVELFGLDLTNSEMSVLFQIFPNIKNIEITHPELLKTRHGISNRYYKNKQIIPSILKKLKLESIQDILSFNKNAQLSNKCILIGGAETVKLGAFGQYIDSSEKTIIRINTKFMPDGYFQFVGHRTDLIIASSFHLNHNIINKDISDQNISIYLTNDIRKTMQIGKAPLTTGFMAFLLCLYLFDEIELLGFGLTNVKQPDGICESFHNFNNRIQQNCRHNLNAEHMFIDQLVKDPSLKVSRIEESHPELLFKII